MERKSGKLSRAEALKGLIVLPALAATVAGSMAPAEAKASQAAVKYQGRPKGGKNCAGCRFFKPNKENHKGMGSCSIVSGPISPNGWCVAWAKK
jgi:hypothetical protein